MYKVGIQRHFSARHFLVGGDWGAENAAHEHHYLLEWRLGADQTDRHGFVADLTRLEAALDAVLPDFEGTLLNQLPGLAGLNPSVERLARLVSDRLLERLNRPGVAPNLQTSEVRIWESGSAWASWSECLPGPAGEISRDGGP